MPSRPPEITRLQTFDVVADQLEHVVDLEIGRIGALELDLISGLGREQQVRRAPTDAILTLRLAAPDSTAR